MSKILLADDSEFVRFEVGDILTSMGHDVTVVENGLDGYRTLRDDASFDMVLSDFNMPVWDGLKMIEQIRELEAYSSIPVGMLTTESSKNLKSRGRELGIAVWYLKPLDRALFEKTITAVLKKYPSAYSLDLKIKEKF